MSVLRKVFFCIFCVLIVSSMAGGLCFSQDKFPSKPIQVIVPFAPGGSNDVLARAVANTWTKYSPQPMVVITKPGAGGVLGVEYVVRSKPDGYTIYLGQGSSPDLTIPHFQKMPYDPFKDLAPVARLSVHSVVVCVSGKSQFKSMKDLVDYARAGNRVTAAASVATGVVDMTLKAMAKRANFPITVVPFTGGADAVTALAGGHLTMGGGHPSEVMPHIKSGRFRPIGVALDKRDPTLPNIPTLKEQGIDVVTWGSVKGVAAPAATPPEVVEYLASTLKKVSEDPGFKKAMAALYQPVMYQNTKEWTVFLHQAYKDYGDLIKELNLKI
ncbi:MAG: tripartite tricarboxylate transporter substrate binding protein [Deltaproteobacteria bacterium]|nr:tripartite tricarboxylate transporter substrate binding protein [Deltaproteobacteria bacterium]